MPGGGWLGLRMRIKPCHRTPSAFGQKEAAFGSSTPVPNRSWQQLMRASASGKWICSSTRPFCQRVKVEVGQRQLAAVRQMAAHQQMMAEMRLRPVRRPEISHHVITEILCRQVKVEGTDCQCFVVAWNRSTSRCSLLSSRTYRAASPPSLSRHESAPSASWLPNPTSAPSVLRSVQPAAGGAYAAGHRAGSSAGHHAFQHAARTVNLTSRNTRSKRPFCSKQYPPRRAVTSLSTSIDSRWISRGRTTSIFSHGSHSCGVNAARAVVSISTCVGCAHLMGKIVSQKGDMHRL